MDTVEPAQFQTRAAKLARAGFRPISIVTNRAATRAPRSFVRDTPALGKGFDFEVRMCSLYFLGRPHRWTRRRPRRSPLFQRAATFCFTESTVFPNSAFHYVPQ